MQTQSPLHSESVKRARLYSYTEHTGNEAKRSKQAKNNFLYYAVAKGITCSERKSILCRKNSHCKVMKEEKKGKELRLLLSTDANGASSFPLASI